MADPSGSGGDEATSGEGRTQRQVDLLYRDHAARLRRTLRGRVACAEDAKDLVQEAFARLLGASSLRSLRTPEAFLNRIVRNLLVDRARRLAARPEAALLEPDAIAVPAEQADAIELEQLRALYRSAVAALPERTREVFLLHRVEELSYREISDRLGIGVRTVE